MSLARTIRTILFPIFNWGQALVVLAGILALVLVAVFGDPLLALYMGIGAYAGVATTMLAMGLAPDEAEIWVHEVGPISAFLGTARLVRPIGDRVWAPARSESRLFESDWISIRETEGGRLILKARKRDLRIILAAIRRQVNVAG